MDNVDLEAATARGVVVMNTPGGNAISAAEHTLSMLLSLVKNIPQASRLHEGGQVGEGAVPQHRAVRQSVLGIIGLGRIGSEVAKRAKAFNLRILVHDPYVSAERAEALGVELVDLPGPVPAGGLHHHPRPRDGRDQEPHLAPPPSPR